MFKYNNIFLLILTLSLFTGCKQTKTTEKRIPSVKENLIFADEAVGEAKQILDADWKTSKVSNAIIYRYHHFTNLFASRQSITIIEVDLNKKVKVDIPHLTSGFIKTSKAGIDAKADAAINGSFFDTSKGGSTVFFKKDGEIFNSIEENSNPFRENAGFTLDAQKKVSVIKKPSTGWQSVSASSLLTSGPLLVLDGNIIEQVQDKFNTNRHPRTAIGVTAINHLIAVVVDGRNAEAYGMSTEELAIVMRALGCIDAMNLDGGGSSTAWVKNLGVVNYPSDNKIFDHKGERGVANVITFTSK